MEQVTMVDFEHMRLGFVGTGTITAAVVSGLRANQPSGPQICLSPRNAAVAARLASMFSGVTVADSNQGVLDCSDFVILAVRPQIARDVLAALRFNSEHRVISLIATFSREQVQSLVRPAISVTCAVPLPPVAAGLGPTAMFPPDSVVAALFDRVGLAVEVASEKELHALLAGSAAMAAFFATLDNLQSWLQEQGVAAATARNYVAMMFHGLGRVAQTSKRPFVELTSEFKTKGGLNEQFADELAGAGVFASYSAALDSILARIERNTTAGPPVTRTT
jgi:pyrroline-5-carboxylate reductase